jgi:HlyD family secretion protein
MQQGDFIHETVVEVTLKIDNPDGELRPGYTARADIKTDETKSIHIVPYSAILQDDVGEYVYVLFGNTALRRDILTGVELADGAQVLAGLREDDEIIATPESITEDMLVAVNNE